MGVKMDPMAQVRPYRGVEAAGSGLRSGDDGCSKPALTC